jgi:hypothetical protein
MCRKMHDDDYIPKDLTNVDYEVYETDGEYDDDYIPKDSFLKMSDTLRC